MKLIFRSILLMACVRIYAKPLISILTFRHEKMYGKKINNTVTALFNFKFKLFSDERETHAYFLHKY